MTIKLLQFRFVAYKWAGAGIQESPTIEDATGTFSDWVGYGCAVYFIQLKIEATNH